MEITGGVYCACVVGCNGYEGGRVEVKYDVEQCIHFRCQNPVCVIRKQERDLSRANIFMMCAAHGSPASAFWRKRKYR